MTDRREPAGHARPVVHESLRCLTLQFSTDEVQSRMQIQDPDALDLEYTRTMMAFLLFQPAPRSITMIGLGGGSLAKFCRRHLPKARIEVVEINPHVIALRDAFRIPPDDRRLRIVQRDGAQFVRDAAVRCDVLMIDGFDGNGQPPRLSSQRFYDDCFEMLHPEGVLVVNLHHGDARLRVFIDRIRRSFDDAVLVVDGVDAVNSIVFACRGNALGRERPAAAPRPGRLGAAAAGQLREAFALTLTALKEAAR